VFRFKEEVMIDFIHVLILRNSKINKNDLNLLLMN
jgi:hypothetical protein